MDSDDEETMSAIDQCLEDKGIPTSRNAAGQLTFVNYDPKTARFYSLDEGNPSGVCVDPSHSNQERSGSVVLDAPDKGKQRATYLSPERPPWVRIAPRSEIPLVPPPILPQQSAHQPNSSNQKVITRSSYILRH